MKKSKYILALDVDGSKIPIGLFKKWQVKIK
jgi:hypothetical protein